MILTGLPLYLEIFLDPCIAAYFKSTIADLFGCWMCAGACRGWIKLSGGQGGERLSDS